MSKNRTTVHKGKVGSAKHNEHKTKGKDKNVTPKSFNGNTDENKFSNGGTLEQKELKFYERYCEQLTQQNEKHKSARQYGRIKSLEEFYNSKRYKPTEEIIQYGHVGGDVPTKEEFDSMMFEYAEWMKEWSKQHGNHLQVLNCVGHHDESTPHGHIRYIWDCVDDDGIIKINQEKAMEQAGLELPHPGEPVGRYNNRNMIFTQICRDKWNDICEQHGYEVERVPLENGRRKSETIPEYHARRGRELQEREQALDIRERGIIEKENEITDNLESSRRLLEQAADFYKKSRDFYLQEQEWMGVEATQHIRDRRDEEAKQQAEIQKLQKRAQIEKVADDEVRDIMSGHNGYTGEQDDDAVSIV